MLPSAMRSHTKQLMLSGLACMGLGFACGFKVRTPTDAHWIPEGRRANTVHPPFADCVVAVRNGLCKTRDGEEGEDFAGPSDGVHLHCSGDRQSTEVIGKPKLLEALSFHECNMC